MDPNNIEFSSDAPSGHHRADGTGAGQRGGRNVNCGVAGVGGSSAGADHFLLAGAPSTSIIAGTEHGPHSFHTTGGVGLAGDADGSVAAAAAAAAGLGIMGALAEADCGLCVSWDFSCFHC